jgi:hypothetical protein
MAGLPMPRYGKFDLPLTGPPVSVLFVLGIRQA